MKKNFLQISAVVFALCLGFLFNSNTASANVAHHCKYQRCTTPTPQGIHVGDCENLHTPWIAFRDLTGLYKQWGELCLEGTGFVNLRDFSYPGGGTWANIPRSINDLGNAIVYKGTNGSGDALYIAGHAQIGYLSTFDQDIESVQIIS